MANEYVLRHNCFQVTLCMMDSINPLVPRTMTNSFAEGKYKIG